MSSFFLTFLFLCVTILYYFIASRVLMNNTNTTKITVFITVALKKALPKILGMPYFISISAYSYLSSVFIVGKSKTFMHQAAYNAISRYLRMCTIIPLCIQRHQDTFYCCTFVVLEPALSYQKSNNTFQ